jgi:hypothetical protein
MTWWINILLAFVFAFGILVGYTMGRVEWTHSDCYDASGTYVNYTAWLSVRDGIYRCIWIEDRYPWRVKLQGVIDVR